MDNDEALFEFFKKARPFLDELVGNEDVVLLGTDTCDLCGRKFNDGEEFYLLKRVRYLCEGGAK